MMKNPIIKVIGANPGDKIGILCGAGWGNSGSLETPAVGIVDEYGKIDTDDAATVHGVLCAEAALRVLAQQDIAGYIDVYGPEGYGTVKELKSIK